MKKQLAAACAALVAAGLGGCGVQARAQHTGPVLVSPAVAPPPVAVSPQYVGGYGPSYNGGGYHAGVPVNGYQPGAPRRVMGKPVAPQRLVVEHAPGEQGQYRCDANGNPTGGQGTGTGWCVRRNR